MSKWRDQNFVADSDDEEDGLSIDETQSPGHHEPAQNHFRYIDDLLGSKSAKHCEGNVASQSTHNKGQSASVTASPEHLLVTQARDENASSAASKDSHAVARAPASYRDDDEQDELQLCQPGSVPALQSHRKQSSSLRAHEISIDLDKEIDELQQSPRLFTSSPILSGQLHGKPAFGAQSDGVSVHKAHEVESPNGQHVFASVNSSPLSEPTSSPPEGQSSSWIRKLFFDDDEALPHIMTLLGTERDDSSGVEKNISSQSLHPAHAGRPARALRQRNQIQMHPYLLEGEMYRQTLQARGIKPLRIDQQEIDRTPVTEPQHGKEVPSARMALQATSSDTDSPNIHYSSSQRASSETTDQAPNTQQGSEIDEFPDLSSLLRNPPGAIVQGYKRRKVAHPPRKEQKYGKKRRALVGVVIDSSEQVSHHRQASVNPLFDVPPSPPVSTESTKSRRASSFDGHFRFPPGTTPNQIRTPVASSELKCPPVRDTGTDTESESSVGTVSVDHSPDDDAIIISSAVESESEHQLVKVQRKIRGVLPASWLRLDLKTQSKAAIVARTSTGNNVSPTKGLFDKGVARPISSNRIQESNLTLSPVSEKSDDSSSDSDTHSPVLQQPSLTHQRHGSEAYSSNFNDAEPSVQPADILEGMEDNRIDWMLPPRPRPHSSQPAKKSRQSRSKNMGHLPKHHKDIEHVRSRVNNSGRQPKISDHVVRVYPPRAARFRPPQLSILDVPERDTSPSLPNFVRVAARATRTRKDKGRHSPSHKAIRLATREDTADVQNTLTKWQQGLLPAHTGSALRGSGSHPSLRDPLNPKSGNSQKRPPAFYLSDHEGDENRHRQLGRIYDKLLNSECRSRPAMRTDLDNTAKGNARRKATAAKGQLSSFVNAPRQSRPAVIESKRIAVDVRRPRHVINTKIPDTWKSGTLQQPSRLEAYLESSFPAHGAQAAPVSQEYHLSKKPSSQPGLVSNRRLVRKTRPRQLNIDAAPFRQDDLPLSAHSGATEVQEEIFQSSHDSRILRGLGSFGTVYTTTFDTFPLVPDIYFDTTTFLGSGEFSQALQFTDKRDLDQPKAPTVWHMGNKVFEWGAWTDSVSSELGLACSKILQALQQVQSPYSSSPCSESEVKAIISIQRSLIAYITRSLHFLDPVDRLAFLQRILGLVIILTDEISNLQPSAGCDSAVLRTFQASNVLHVYVSMLDLVLVHQLSLIASHEIASRSLRDDINTQLQRVARQTIALSMRSGCNMIRKFQRLLPAGCRTISDQEDRHPAESVIIVYHVTKSQSANVSFFWDLVNSCIDPLPTSGVFDVSVLDRHWQVLIGILPLLEFDTYGMIEKNRRFKEASDGWSEIRSLIRPVLDAYTSASRARDSTFNSYCRAILTRCFVLVQQWGWKRSETMIWAFFDFFGRIGLGNLRNETNHGSPAFLEHLTETLELEVCPGDRCFHIFLKLLGLGLREMRGIYSDKKIRDIIFRMLPNHDRRHPKDEAISQEDLDALRNHHDLICVLYWASPSGFRPRLSILRNLTQLEDSHKEACRIHIRSWSHLVSYQISVREPVSELDPFAEWYNDIVSQLVRQHSLARLEVEAQVKAAESTGDHLVPAELQQSTIARNQRQVEALLGDALQYLCRAINNVRSADQAERLLSTNLVQVFELFDAKQPRTNTVIIQALDVILTFAQHFKPAETSDDSQDYGDLSAFAELTDLLPPEIGIALKKPIYDSLRRLLSNCFGADTAPEDTVLVKIVQVWSVAAQLSVSHGPKTWNDYIGPYGNDSWHSLGDTEQRGKFSGFFLATLIEDDQRVYQNHTQLVLRLWIASLVEREALLKFQHKLTSVILNMDRDNALFVNLPFWVETQTGCYNITAAEFRERRTSLISCLLSNMRESLSSSTYTNLSQRATRKAEYTELLRQLMSTMKHNYQELGASSGIRGAYVDLVHRVIENLQQHCTDICKVDQFFTNPSLFPLPATDPSYVVGRLKNYALRLQEPKGALSLCEFFRAVSERAAAENQQHYLVDQLFRAMSQNFERSDSRRPTIRYFVVQAIFPAYARHALCSSSGALLATPLLQALGKVLEDIIGDVDGFDEGSVAAITATIFTLLDCLHNSAIDFGTRHEVLESPLIVRILRLYFELLRFTLPILNYITRLHHQVSSPRQYLFYFQELGQALAAKLLGHGDVLASTGDRIMPLPEDEQIKGTRLFALGELNKSLQTDWSVHDGRFYFTKGRTRSEVHVDVGTLEDETNQLLARIEDFSEMLRKLDDEEERPGLRPQSVLEIEELRI
ncbi:hypothetical protein MMC13_000698 [Lambiella insularis]|nr:hypothetical protein [Lambiella insularis]